jgi:hypothetical protein
MIWLTWRLQRTEALIGAAILAIVAVLLVISGVQVANGVAALKAAGCDDFFYVDVPSEACRVELNRQSNLIWPRWNAARWLVALPAVIGLLLAAPVVGELERGSHRFAFTQGISRRRWLTHRVGLLAMTTVGVSVALLVLMRWWQSAFGSFQQYPFDTVRYEVSGIVPFGYALLALALVLAAGVVVRRPVPVIALALVAFIGVRLLVASEVRERFWPAETATSPGFSAMPQDISGGWVVAERWVDATGRRLSDQHVFTVCQPPATLDPSVGEDPVGRFFEQCFAANGIMRFQAWHPADRFWPFQLAELGLFLALGAGLLGFTYWWVTRRVE